MPLQVLRTLIFLLLSVTATAQELTLYVLPAPKPINWHSPRSLVFSYINNAIVANKYGKGQKHAIGHVMVELKYNERYALVGTTATSNRYMMHKVMHRGWGLGILFATINGKLEEADINQPQLQERTASGEMAYVRYKINAIMFERLWTYLQEYKARGYDKYYNGENNPRAGKGAGCTAFGHSFLEVGGLQYLLNDSNWKVNVRVQDGLIGRPIADRRVSIFKLMMRGRWAKEKHRHRHLQYYEPTLMYNDILSKMNNNTIGTKDSIGKAKGIVIDASLLLPPDESIWKD